MPSTLVNARSYTAFAPIQEELSLKPKQNYLFDLSYLGCLDISGSRASTFLQGQLSCDLREVGPEQMRQGVMCNLKGRVLALLDVVDWRGLRLIIPNDLIADTQLSLSKTAALSQVKLSPSSNYQLFGFLLQNRDDLIPFNAHLPDTLHHIVEHDTYCCYHLGEGYYIFLVEKTCIPDLCEPFMNRNQWRGSLAWHALQLQQSRIEIYPESRSLFLPHRLRLDLSGHLNFNKGCYKGQEIVARMHYRAKRTHAMKLFTLKINEPLQSGQRLLDENQIELGELIDFCPIGDGLYLCAANVPIDSISP